MLPPTASTSTCTISESEALPPMPFLAASEGILVARRLPPIFVSSAAVCTFSSSTSPTMFLRVTLPPISFRTTSPAPSIVTLSLSCVTLISVLIGLPRGARPGTHKLRSPSLPLMITVSPSCRNSATVPAISTLMLRSFQAWTLRLPLTCVITTRGFLSTEKVCWAILFSIFLFKPVQGIPIPGACLPGLGTGTLTPRANYSFAFSCVLSLSLAPQGLDQEIAFLRSNAAFSDHAQDGYALLLRIRLRRIGCCSRAVTDWLLGRCFSPSCTFSRILLYRHISGR